jgi:ElaB/YqjD/DUF883 family membrane-anchored ribosome-binding protein
VPFFCDTFSSMPRRWDSGGYLLKILGKRLTQPSLSLSAICAYNGTTMSTSPETATPADALKTQASEAVRKVSETINDQANVLRDTAQGVRYNTQDFIENNPWQSVIIAGAVGLLVGIIIARR